MNAGERPRTRPKTRPPQLENVRSTSYTGAYVQPSSGAPAIRFAARAVWWGNSGGTDLGHRGHGSPLHRGRCLLAPHGARTAAPRDGYLPLPPLPSVASPRHRCRSNGQASPSFERPIPGRGRIRSVEHCASRHCGWAGTGGCQKARRGNPHHNRTRSSEEQRGTTVTSDPANSGRNPAVRPGQQPNRPHSSAASQANALQPCGQRSRTLL